MYRLGKRSPFVLAGGLLVVCVSRDAQATVTVERAAGAESCPDERAFVEMMYSSREDVTRIDRKDVRVRFERTSNGYRSWVRMANGTQRSLSDDAASCDGLADATALAIKLVDLEGDADPAPPPSRAPTKSPHPTAPPPMDERAPPAPPPSKSGPAHVAELSAGGVWGRGAPSEDVTPRRASS